MRSISLAILLAACGVTETGNPEFDAAFALRARSTDPDTVAVGSGDAVVVSAAWLAVDRVRLVRGEVCDAPGEIEVDVASDLVTDAAASAPDVTTVLLEADDYCRVRVRLERATTTGAAPSDLADHSILVVGTRTDGTEFRIRTRTTPEVDVRAADGPFALDEAQDSVVVALDVATWLDGVDLDTADVDTDDVIRIDDANNDTLLDLFEDNLDEALELFVGEEPEAP